VEQNQMMGDPKHEGQRAFRAHGVTGQYKHSYAKDSVERIQFIGGFSEERNRAAERAIDEAQAYHALTVREAARDREWAAKLSSLPAGHATN
jgi:hypothetical protein